MNETTTTKATEIGGISTNSSSAKVRYAVRSILVHEIDKAFGCVARLIMQGKRARHKESVLIRIEGPYHMTMGIEEDDIIPVAVAVYAAMHRGGGSIEFEYSPVPLKDLEAVQLLMGSKGEKTTREDMQYFLSSMAFANYIAFHELSEVIAFNQKDDKNYVVNIENIFNVFEDTFTKILHLSENEDFDGFNKKLYKIPYDITGLRKALGSEDLRDQVAMGLGRIIDTAPENCSANSHSGGGKYAN